MTSETRRFSANARRGAAVLASLAVAFALEAVPAHATTVAPTTITSTGTTSYTIPSGVTKVKVELWGAQGGFNGGSSGGNGAYVSFSLTVTPAAALTLAVGGKGGDTFNGTAGAAGFNGGGAGGAGTDTSWRAGGGGGGATSVVQGGTLVAVAGGGGGGTSSSGGSGGLNGSSGQNNVAAGGGGASTSAVGSGGTGTASGSSGQSWSGTAVGVGGAGGDTTNGTRGGGGGGGGYFGGGGGGGGNGPAGGGGGSSLVPAGGSASSGVSASNGGDGKAVITPFPNAPSAPTGVGGNQQNTVSIVPATDGGTAASFTVTQSPGGATCTPSGSPFACTFNSLTNGSSYTYTATATNAAGTSVVSSQSAAVIPAGPVNATASTLTPPSTTIAADGLATQVLTVQAKDAAGISRSTGGDTVTITKSSGSGTVGTVTDNNNGTYTATVTAPAAAGTGAFVATLNGSPVKSGGASQTVSTVTYSASAVATLSSLTLSSGAISPAFVASTLAYSAAAALNPSPVTVTPTVSDVLSTVTVNGSTVTSGSPSGPITLVAGSNMISVVVTAQDGVTTTTYVITISVPEPLGPPPPPWLQSYALLGNSTCTVGWGQSWDWWAVPVSGGAVCNRLIYFREGLWWSVPGFSYPSDLSLGQRWEQ